MRGPLADALDRDELADDLVVVELGQAVERELMLVTVKATPELRSQITELASIFQARIDDVVAKVLASADAHGLSHDIAEPVWRLMVDRCIAYEFGSWDRSRTPEGQPLEGVLRD